MPPKRACDTCISRKVKCSGSWPCDTCRDAPKKVSCTYLRPVRRRGPKVKRTARKDQGLLWSPISSGPRNDAAENHPASPVYDGQQTLASDIPLPPYISKDILAPIIHLYRQFSYSVWPIINADALLEQLDDIHIENAVYTPGNMACLVTAMCAATMAQLDIPPVKDDLETVNSTILVQVCLQIRSQYYNQRVYPDVGSVLVSFFLHVYHAKVNQCTTAMMYIHEAISGAKSLGLDKLSRQTEELQPDREHDTIANRELVFPLLWVSER